MNRNNLEQIDATLVCLSTHSNVTVFLPIRGDVYTQYDGKLEYNEIENVFMWTVGSLHFKASDVDEIKTLTDEHDEEYCECLIYLKEWWQYR